MVRHVLQRPAPELGLLGQLTEFQRVHFGLGAQLAGAERSSTSVTLCTA